MSGEWALAENLRESQGINGDSQGQPGNTRECQGKHREKSFWRPWRQTA